MSFLGPFLFILWLGAAGTAAAWHLLHKPPANQAWIMWSVVLGCGILVVMFRPGQSLIPALLAAVVGGPGLAGVFAMLGRMKSGFPKPSGGGRPLPRLDGRPPGSKGRPPLNFSN